MLNSVDDLFKLELRKFVEKLNLKFNINLSSIGFTTYIYNETDRYSKMSTLSLESVEFNQANKNYIREKGSIITPSDFIENDFNKLLLHKKIKSGNIDVKEMKFFPPETFNYDISNYEGIRSLKDISYNKEILKTHTDNVFEEWVEYISNYVGGNYFLKRTYHKNIDDQNILGTTCFIINTKESNFKGKKGEFYKEIFNFISKSENSFYFLSLALKSYYEDVEKRTKRLRKATRISSLASIISRGMSHTDGSHSMKYFEENFIELANQNTDTKSISTLFTSYNQHLRHVMELTADVTGGIGNQTSYAFDFGDIIKKIQKVYFPEPNKIDYYPDIYTLSKPIVDNEKNCVLFGNHDKLKNKRIMLPGGVNGATALLQILKNIYRNIFKHNLSAVSGKSIRLDVGLDDLEDRNPLCNNYYQLVITEKLKTEEEKYNILNNHIKQGILNDDGEIDENAWGIKEIKIHAAYLIGLAIEELDNEDYHLKKIFNRNNPWYSVSKNEAGQLEHKFFLKKEKKVIVIVDSLESEKRLNTKDNNNKGLYYLFLNETKKQEWYHHIDNDFQYVVFQSIRNNKSKSRNFKLINNVNQLEDFDIDKIDVEWVKCLDSSSSSGNILMDEAHSRQLKEKSGFTKDDKRISEKIWNELDYYEPLIANNQYNEYEKKLSFSSNIALLDERLQKELWKSEYRHAPIMVDNDGRTSMFTKAHLLEKRGIFTPNFEDESLNLYKLFYGKTSDNDAMNRENTDEDFNQFVERLKHYFYKKKCIYVIVHFSGLEVLANGLSDLAINDIESELRNKRSVNEKVLKASSKLDKVYSYLIKVILNLQGSGKYLLLTSGKGTPTTLPNHSYFINLNNVEYLLNTKGVTKLDFIKKLESIRQIKN